MFSNGFYDVIYNGFSCNQGSRNPDVDIRFDDILMCDFLSEISLYYDDFQHVFSKRFQSKSLIK